MGTLAKRYKRRQTQMRAKSLLSTDMLKQMRHEETVISQFLEDRDVPTWFRGSSQFQLQAANRLLNAIRDDTEQRTSHRVRQCLNGMGLHPNISAGQANLLMRLSRGNDLAFLWFLLELCYKTNGPEYSVNEQLIMSSIAHLDMITTLRELDRILPPPELSKQEWERRRRWAERDATRFNNVKKRKKKREQMMPYFEKLVRPRPYGQSLTVPMPDFRLSFGSYERYKNADYMPPNELNRWYERYELQPGKRIVNRILRETVGEIFDDYEGCLTRANRNEMLCEHHKVIREMEETLEAELKVLAREKCLDYINPNKRRQAERVARITKALNCEVKRFMYKFRMLANKSKRQMLIMSITSDDDCQYHMVDKSDVGWLDEEDLEEGRLGDGDMEGVEYASTTQRLSVDKQTSEPTATLPGKAKHVGGGGAGDCLASEQSSNESEHFHRRPSKGRVSMAETLISVGQQQQQQPQQRSNSCAFPSGENMASTRPNSSSTLDPYFEAATDHKPYIFHYRKIFTFKEEPSENKRLQQSIIQALLSDVDLRKYAENSHMNVNKALQDCVDQQWCAGVKAKNAELKALAEAEAEAERNKPDSERGLLTYDREYYDPDDQDFMEQMLKDAICAMKKNPKFVLASMPDAYKVPLLKEWIYHRYGKRYSREDLYKSFRHSLKIFKALEKITLQVRLPTTKQLGSEFFVDYSCRNYLLKKSNFIKDDYYKRLNASIMEQARVFWFAMRPYLCSNGPPRNTYFAYMPAAVKDILHFRIWKPNEFMNAKGQWDRRQAQKRRNKS